MFLEKFWYVVATSEELLDKPVGRTVLNRPLVVFRQKDGTVSVLEDLCPHRKMPLSEGEIVEGHLQCAYHGLTVNGAGKCVKVYGQDAIPPVDVKSFTAVEKDKFIWVWIGDEEQCDASAIPNCPEHTDPAWVGKMGSMIIECNYRLMIENLLDLSHIYFVHRSTFGAGEDVSSLDTYESELVRTKNSVNFTRWAIDVPAPEIAKAAGLEGNADRWEIIDYWAPGLVRLDTGASPTGLGVRENPEMRKQMGAVLYFFMTPETETSHRYFFSQYRCFSIDDSEITDLYFGGAQVAFAEDKHVLEAQQTNIGKFSDAQTVNLKSDKPALAGMGILDRLENAARRKATGTG
jgi:vanillate O-demethylase monooxygenase subunit